MPFPQSTRDWDDVHDLHEYQPLKYTKMVSPIHRADIAERSAVKITKMLKTAFGHDYSDWNTTIEKIITQTMLEVLLDG